MFKTKLILIPIILVILSGVAANGQEKPGRGWLRMEISTARKCYPRPELIPVSLKITNTRRFPVYMEKRPWGLQVFPYDEKGKRADNPDLMHPPGQSSPLPLEDFRKINPGRSVIYKEYAYAGKEGVITLIGYYRSLLFKRHIPRELSAYKVWGINDSDVQSPSLDITVSSQCKE
jgi:hypothetical protein